ncbi:MAG: DUF4783 domain-containing protein [Saprospiraceae bacterium]
MNKYHRSVYIFMLSLFLDFSLLGQMYTSNPVKFTDLKYADSVEIRSRTGSNVLLSSEAKQTIDDFFKKISPQEIKTLHKGYSKDKSSYYGILQLITSTGNHRLFYYCENVNGKFLITKVRIHER